MNLIAAVDKNWGIGKNNDLLFHIKEDMKFFKEKTVGNVIIVGRKTLESFPSSKPLPDRKNIVLTRDGKYKCEDAIIVHSVSELLEFIKKCDKDVYVCGGAEIYSILLPYCDTAYITRVDADADAQKFMPNLDEIDGWSLEEDGEIQNNGKYNFKFCVYKNSKSIDY